MSVKMILSDIIQYLETESPLKITVTDALKEPMSEGPYIDFLRKINKYPDGKPLEATFTRIVGVREYRCKLADIVDKHPELLSYHLGKIDLSKGSIDLWCRREELEHHQKG